MAEKIPAALMPVTKNIGGSRPPRAQRQVQMHAAGPAKVHALLPTNTGASIDAPDHGQDRCSLPGRSLQRQPSQGGVSGTRRDPVHTRPGAKPHSAHRFTGDLPEATHHRSRRPIRAIPLPGGPQAGHDSGPDMGDRHHLHPAAEGFALPGGDRGSVLKECAQLEALEQPGHGVLSRGSENGVGG